MRKVKLIVHETYQGKRKSEDVFTAVFLSYVSGEIWLISMAMNFALGKQIFCYPWLNEIDIARFEIAYQHGIIKLLKDLGKIILVPSSQKKILRKKCDHTILFEKQKITYQ